MAKKSKAEETTATENTSNPSINKKVKKEKGAMATPVASAETTPDAKEETKGKSKTDNRKSKDKPTTEVANKAPSVELTGRKVTCFVSKRDIDEAFASEIPYLGGQKVWVTKTLIKF